MSDKQKYPTSAAQIGNSDKICREDVIGRDVTLTLAPAAEGKGAVSLGQAQLPGRKPEDRYVLHFSETTKTLVLNATNRKALQRMFGNDVREWVGKRVTLYYDATVRCPDGSKGGTRIREAAQQEGPAK